MLSKTELVIFNSYLVINYLTEKLFTFRNNTYNISIQTAMSRGVPTSLVQRADITSQEEALTIGFVCLCDRNIVDSCCQQRGSRQIKQDDVDVKKDARWRGFARNWR